MNPIKIIEKYYRKDSEAYNILISHSRQVAKKAGQIADRVAHLKPDRNFIEEASLLHDIGMLETRTPQFDCYGQHPYVCHGYLGRQMLEKEGFHRHALVCERHLGVGITCQDISQQRLPIPDRNMTPQTIEEQIICYADKFFSKNGTGREKTVEEILEKLESYGMDKVQRFQQWADLFGG